MNGGRWKNGTRTLKQTTQQTLRFKWNIMWIWKGEAWKERSSWVRSFMIDILLILSNFLFWFSHFFFMNCQIWLLCQPWPAVGWWFWHVEIISEKTSGFGCQRVSIFFSILMEKPFAAVHEMLPRPIVSFTKSPRASTHTTRMFDGGWSY